MTARLTGCAAEACSPAVRGLVPFLYMCLAARLTRPPFHSCRPCVCCACPRSSCLSRPLSACSCGCLSGSVCRETAPPMSCSAVAASCQSPSPSRACVPRSCTTPPCAFASLRASRESGIVCSYRHSLSTSPFSRLTLLPVLCPSETAPPARAPSMRSAAPAAVGAKPCSRRSSPILTMLLVLVNYDTCTRIRIARNTTGARPRAMRMGHPRPRAIPPWAHGHGPHAHACTYSTHTRSFSCTLARADTGYLSPVRGGGWQGLVV